MRRGNLHIATTEGTRIFPTPHMRQRIMELTHERLMHVGYVKLTQAIEESYYWPGMRKDIKDHC